MNPREFDTLLRDVRRADRFAAAAERLAWNNDWADGGPGAADLLTAEFAARARRLGAALRSLMPGRRGDCRG